MEKRQLNELTTSGDSNGTHAEMLEAIYNRYYDGIFAYCVHRLFCRTAAEDVTSQVFLSAARGIDSFSGDGPQAAVGWLYRIATNQCNAYLRKNLRRRKIFEKFQRQHYTDQTAAEPSPDWTAVYGAISQLKPIEQTVITLRFFEHKEFEQIAAIINKRQPTVRVILHRGLKKLRKLLNSAACGFDRG
ncbi:MAG: sigma-70 family RNA polymerase sigma factor [Planctomycetaceae bacterium]|nr:sigma-70 family RNA polymerase sigma factor [Planctomycetaceae bacterium]